MKNKQKKSSEKLTARQEKFCQEYIVDLNGTQAAIRAGYSAKTANRIGVVLLSNVVIQKKISELISARAEETKISAENVIKEVAECSFFDPSGIYDENGQVLPFPKWPAICRRMNKSFDTIETANGAKIHKIRWHDKGKFTELLMRHLGLLKDKLEVSTEDVTLRGILEDMERVKAERKKAAEAQG